ncbi:O-antigen ligase domain-containing protein [Coleofasciculus sp. E2-BRE-01]|uniref:O-antigen ligase domain-containing protein n=1 Tax=Coleofasciculus sp. E2-BRE-01 TaxID=3069524 RepID=UPI0032F5419D
MSPLVPLVMFGWIPAVLYLFKRFPAQWAVVISFILAWQFLPQASYPLPGLPDYTKMSATCYGILLATLIYDVGRFQSFKFGWLDVPMLIWCFSPLASSLSNNLGLYDGLSASFGQIVQWGIPYFIGRIYLNNWAGLQKLAIGIFLGGLIYVPLCLYEIRMSPQLHAMVYGFAPTNFLMTIRYGGYRPIVFMRHGLTLGMWMMAATLIGIWLWRSGLLKKLWGIPMSWLVAVLLITFVLVKSTGAYIYLFFGVAILFLTRWFRTTFPLLLLVVSISSYLFLGATGNFTGDMKNQLVSFLADVTTQERAESLEFRLDNEELLGDKARQRPIFGWGGWGRSRVYDYNWAGELVDVSITDSFWIITFGTNGSIGLISIMAARLLPPACFCLRYPAHSWSNPKVAPSAVLAVVLTLYVMDGLLNAQPNPVYTVVHGGLAGLMLNEVETRNSRSIRSSIPRRSLHQKKHLVGTLKDQGSQEEI